MFNEYSILVFIVALFTLIKLTYQDIKNDKKISRLDVMYLSGFTTFYIFLTIKEIIPAIITLIIVIIGNIILCKILHLANGDQETLQYLIILLAFTGYYNAIVFIILLILLDLGYKTYLKIVHPNKQSAPYLPIILTTWTLTHLILIL